MIIHLVFVTNALEMTNLTDVVFEVFFAICLSSLNTMNGQTRLEHRLYSDYLQTVKEFIDFVTAQINGDTRVSILISP